MKTTRVLTQRRSGSPLQLLDGIASAGATFYYTMEHVDVTGGQSPHGPVKVAARWYYLPLIGWEG